MKTLKKIGCWIALHIIDVLAWGFDSDGKFFKIGGWSIFGLLAAAIIFKSAVCFYVALAIALAGAAVGFLVVLGFGGYLFGSWAIELGKWAFGHMRRFVGRADTHRLHLVA